MIRDVVIVGGGPVGLMLACELRLQGASVTVLEKLDEPTRFSKALGMSDSAIGTIELRGLLERFSEDSPPFKSALAHFGGAPLARSYYSSLFTQQTDSEDLLEEHAYKLGVRLRWGHEVIALTQHADGMLLHIRDQLGEYELRTRHLVECDGRHSAVYNSALMRRLPRHADY